MDRQSEIDQENLQKKEEISISKPELKRKKSRWGDSLPDSNEKLLRKKHHTLWLYIKTLLLPFIVVQSPTEIKFLR